jgi:quinol monooxygenase YgiN
MHVVVRTYTAAPNVLEEARPKLPDLEQTMRQTPGFVAYYFLETEDGIATITITEDEAGTQESMSRAATWVQQNLPQSGGSMSAPDVITGQALISAMR